MSKLKPENERPDVEAAIRGGDWSLRMDGENIPADSSLKQALYWRQIYSEILAMEEKVLHRIHQLMAKQSAAARREVELTNVPVVVAQAEKFRQRLGYWEARIQQLDASSP
jgi:predicted NAD/FAD-binding protein